MIEHIDFHISYKCLNKCIFCSSSDSMEKFGNHPLEIECLIKLLGDKRKKGFKSVNFTGGEPTIFPSFLKLIRETKKLGYKIYVGTNGGRFADRNFCFEAANFLDEVCFSLHGHTPRLHNFLTGDKGSFKRLRKALDNLSQFPIRFSSNTVVTKYNFGSLEKILGSLKRNRIKQVLISNLAPEGRGLINYDQLVVKLKDFRSLIPTLVKVADKSNMIIRFFGLSACILGNFACHSNDFSWDNRLNIEQAKNKRFYLEEEESLSPQRKRIKPLKCQCCLYNQICGGIFQEYFERFGDGELKPFKK